MAREIPVSAHKLSLARELLDDVELGRLNPENLLLKGIRLARLIGDDETRQWLSCELSGYAADSPRSQKHMSLTGRLTDGAETLACRESLAQIEAQIAIEKSQAQRILPPPIPLSADAGISPSAAIERGEARTEKSPLPVERGIEYLSPLERNVIRLTGIRSRVLALLHEFASQTYYLLAFSNLQETLFERQKNLVESQLASRLGSLLDRIPDLYDRLAQNSFPAIRESLAACRKILEAFAESLHAPEEQPDSLPNSVSSGTPENSVYPVESFLQKSCESPSRRRRLLAVWNEVYARVSSPSVADLTADEVRFLFLQTYLLLGEILLLEGKEPDEEGTPS